MVLGFRFDFVSVAADDGVVGCKVVVRKIHLLYFVELWYDVVKCSKRASHGVILSVLEYVGGTWIQLWQATATFREYLVCCLVLPTAVTMMLGVWGLEMGGISVSSSRRIRKGRGQRAPHHHLPLLEVDVPRWYRSTVPSKILMKTAVVGNWRSCPDSLWEAELSSSLFSILELSDLGDSSSCDTRLVSVSASKLDVCLAISLSCCSAWNSGCRRPRRSPRNMTHRDNFVGLN